MEDVNTVSDAWRERYLRQQSTADEINLHRLLRTADAMNEPWTLTDAVYLDAKEVNAALQDGRTADYAGRLLVLSARSTRG